MNILDLLPRYVIYLEHERKLAKQTRTAYLSDLRGLAKFTGDDVTAINLNKLRAYQRDLSHQGLAIRTIRRKFHGFATFWQWMRMEGIVEDVPTDRIHLPRPERKTPDWLNAHELKVWVTTPAYGLRNEMAWKTLAWFGLRRSEVLNLLVRDVRLDTLLIRKAKGGKDRSMVIPDQLVKGFAQLIDGQEPDNYLFQADQGDKWGLKSFMTAFRKHVKHCDFKGKRVTPHTLRHSFATSMVEQGVHITIVQKLLGHEDINSTMIYEHAAPEQLRLAMSRHVLNNLDKEK